jgi:hypothetical protein
VRAISHDVVKNNGRFSSMVMGVVTSKPFQMNTKHEAVTNTASAKTGAENARAKTGSEKTGVN